MQTQSNMTIRIQRNRDFFRSLLQCTKKQRDKNIQLATKDNIDALSEAALNTLKGNVPLESGLKKKLKRHCSRIRQLAHKRVSRKRKKELLVQQGGFLPLLIPAVLTAVGSLAASAIGKAVGI